MPGLAVIIGPADPPENESTLHRMIASMQHEPYYTTGSYVDRDAHLYIAWSVHPGAYCDCMPIKNEEDDMVLFFYGEHHGRESNDGSQGCAGTARRVLPLIASQDERDFQALNGWFHGVL